MKSDKSRYATMKQHQRAKDLGISIGPLATIHEATRMLNEALVKGLKAREPQEESKQ